MWIETPYTIQKGTQELEIIAEDKTFNELIAGSH